MLKNKENTWAIAPDETEVFEGQYPSSVEAIKAGFVKFKGEECFAIGKWVLVDKKEYYPNVSSIVETLLKDISSATGEEGVSIEVSEETEKIISSEIFGLLINRFPELQPFFENEIYTVEDVETIMSDMIVVENENILYLCGKCENFKKVIVENFNYETVTVTTQGRSVNYLLTKNKDKKVTYCNQICFSCLEEMKNTV